MEFFNQLILAVSVASFITFQVLFHYLSSWVSTRVSPGFKKLSEKQKIEWNSRYRKKSIPGFASILHLRLVCDVISE